MIFMNVILSFIFQRCCLGLEFTQGVGYLCEGTVENLQNSLVGAQGYIEEKKGKTVFFDCLEEQYTLDATENTPESSKNNFHLNQEFIYDSNDTKKIFSYKYIICETKKKYWGDKKRLPSWDFHNTFKVEGLKRKSLKIAGIPKDEGESNTMKAIEAIYKLTIKKIVMIFDELLNLCCNDEKAFVQKVMDYKNQEKTPAKESSKEKGKNSLDGGMKLLNLEEKNGDLLHNATLVNESGEVFDVRKRLLDELNYLIINNTLPLEKILTYQQLKNRYNMKFIKSIVDDHNEPLNKLLEEKIKNHIKNYYALMNEFSLFFGDDRYANYHLADQVPKYRITKKISVIILKVKFSEEEIKNEKNKIEHNDIIFYKNNEIILIESKLTTIRYFSEKLLSYIVIDREELIQRKINFIRLKGCSGQINVYKDVHH